MTVLDVRTVEICPWALREGIVLRHLETIAQRPAMPLRAVTPLARPSALPEATVTQLRTTLSPSS